MQFLDKLSVELLAFSFPYAVQNATWVGWSRKAKCLSGNFSLKTLDERRHGLPNMLLSGTSFNFAIWKSESNQTHVSGRTLRPPTRHALDLGPHDAVDHARQVVIEPGLEQRAQHLLHQVLERARVLADHGLR